MRPDAVLRLATRFYAVALAAAFLWAWLTGGLGTLFGERAPAPIDLLRGGLLGVAIVGACHFGLRFSKAVRRAADVMGGFLGPLTGAQAVWLAVLSGFAEELLFRGALWPQLGLIGSSILFGVLHTVPMRALAGYPVFAAFAGLLFGALREASGSIWPPVVAHFTVNALNLGLVGRAERERRGGSPPPPPSARPLSDVFSEPDPEGGDDTFPITVWRYDLRVELTGTDRTSLPDCLEHEDLAVYRFVEKEEVLRQLRDGSFVFVETRRAPLPEFPEDIATISTYLFEPVIGIEVAERFVDERNTDDVRAWKVVGRRGEWVKVPLVVEEIEPGRFMVDPDREDEEVLGARWATFPRWFQDGMRFKYPRLREL